MHMRIPRIALERLTLAAGVSASVTHRLGYRDVRDQFHSSHPWTRGVLQAPNHRWNMAEKILLDKEEADLLNRAPGNPHWHPDGRTIFFDMTEIFLVDLYSIEIDGTKFQEIRKGAGLPLPYRVWPTPFSPDGRKLLYNDCFDECYSLLVLDLETGTSVEISPHTDYGAWSPDGQKIAYGSVWDPGLFVSTVDGSLKQKLLGDAFSDRSRVGEISWSPDGSKIAFTRIEPDTFERFGESLGIYEVNADGSGLRERDSHYQSAGSIRFEVYNSLDQQMGGVVDWRSFGNWDPSLVVPAHGPGAQRMAGVRSQDGLVGAIGPVLQLGLSDMTPLTWHESEALPDSVSAKTGRGDPGKIKKRVIRIGKKLGAGVLWGSLSGLIVGTMLGSVGGGAPSVKVSAASLAASSGARLVLRSV